MTMIIPHPAAASTKTSRPHTAKPSSDPTYAPGLRPEPTLVWSRDDAGKLVQDITYR